MQINRHRIKDLLQALQDIRKESCSEKPDIVAIRNTANVALAELPPEQWEYAVVTWSIHDIPEEVDMTDLERAEWWQENGRNISNILTTRGNEAVYDLLKMDGHKLD